MKIDFDDKNVRVTLANMQKNTKNIKIALNLIGDTLVKSVRQNFISGGRPPWKKSSGKKTLVGLGMRGGLMGSIHYQIDGNTVTVMPDKRPYAAIHQFGGTIKAKNAKNLKFKVNGQWVSKKQVVIPARPYMLIQKEDEARIKELLAKYITEGK